MRDMLERRSRTTYDASRDHGVVLCGGQAGILGGGRGVALRRDGDGGSESEDGGGELHYCWVEWCVDGDVVLEMYGDDAAKARDGTVG